MFEEIRRVLSKTDLPWVLLALQEDELVRQALADAVFLKDALVRSGSQAGAWSPAALGLTALGAALDLDAVRNGSADVFSTLADGWRERAENLLHKEEPGSLDLSAVAEVALALLEEFRRTGDWASVFKALQHKRPQALPAWFGSALGVLYGCVPDGAALLRAFLDVFLSGESAQSDAAVQAARMAVHAALCQPQTQGEQVRVIGGLAAGLTGAGARVLLRALYEARAGLAEKIARALIEAQPDLIRIPEDTPDAPSLGDLLERLERLQEGMEISRMANLADAGEAFLRQAESLTQSLQERLAAQLAFASARKGEESFRKSAALKREGGKTETQARLALSLLDGGQVDAAGEIADALKGSVQAEACLVLARLALQRGSADEALRCALQALADYRSRQAEGRLAETGAQETGRDLALLGGMFLELDGGKGSLAHEAAHAARMSLSIQSEQPQALQVLSRARRLTGDGEGALESAYLALGFAPAAADARRTLALALESAGEWTSALETWQALVLEGAGEGADAQRADSLGLAACALHCDEKELVESTAQALLDRDANDAEARAFLGRAALLPDERGATDWEAARAAFQEAIRLQPQSGRYFRDLSDACAAGESIEEALDAARQALGLAPADRETLLWFAAQTVRLQRPLEAQDVLAWAARLYPQDTALNIQTARVQYAAGQKDRALALLEGLQTGEDGSAAEVCQIAACYLDFDKPSLALQTLASIPAEVAAADGSADAEVQRLKAHAYHMLGEYEHAMQALDRAVALSGGTKKNTLLCQKAEIYLDMQQPGEAAACLGDVIARDGQNGTARSLLLTILRQSGDLQGAMDQARALTGAPLEYRLEGAELALDVLDLDLAEALLEGNAPRLDAALKSRRAVLRAETMLLHDGQAHLDFIRDFSPEDVRAAGAIALRLAALQARAGAGELPQALESALDVHDLITLGEARIACGDYAGGLGLLRRAFEISPYAVRPALAYAGGLVRCAEIQRLCSTGAAKKHAPGAQALSAQAYAACREALEQTNDRLSVPSTLPGRMQKRAELVFSVSPDNRSLATENLLASGNAEDAAACIAALPEGQALPELNDARLDEHWWVCAARALALAGKPAEALTHALLAAERVPQEHALVPIMQALAAAYARAAGDVELAVQAYRKAIRTLGDEPAWLAGCAEAEAQSGDHASAVTHYELALALEPENAALRLKAAEFLMDQAGSPQRAASLVDELPAGFPLPQGMKARLAERLQESGAAAMAVSCYLDALAEMPATAAPESARLAEGLARAAAASGDRLAAVQALNTALQTHAASLPLWKSLSEVSVNAGRNAEALDAAGKALALAPGDAEMQGWYAEQALRADRPLEAVALLTGLVKSKPQAITLYVRLARALMRAGRKEDALETLRFARLAPGTGFQDLLDAAQGLLEIGESDAAVACLERARSEFIEMDAEEQYSLLLSLADAYTRSGNPELGLQAALDAAQLKPQERSRTVPLQVRIQRAMGDLAGARTTLDEFIAAEPQNADARMQMIALLREIGDAAGVLEQVRGFVSETLTARIPAAEVALQYLELDLAEALLKGEMEGLDVPARVRFACANAETALERDADAAVAADVSMARSLLDASPALVPQDLSARVHALEGRLTGALDHANHGGVAADLSEMTLLNLAEARTAAGDFTGAAQALRQVEDRFPLEPRVLLARAKHLVRTAEAARFCAPLNAARRAPASDAYDAAAYETCRTSLQSAHSHALSTSPLIPRWSARSQAVFEDQQAPDASLLAGTPEDVAAYALALARPAGLKQALSGAHAEHWRVQTANALGLSNSAEQTALACARKASQGMPQRHFYCPPLHMLLARLASRAGKKEEALQAARLAAEAWNDEPSFLLEAAALSAENGDIPEALDGLRRAVDLEPHNGRLRVQAAQVLIDKAVQPQQAADLLAELDDANQPPAETWGRLAEALLPENAAEAYTAFSRAIAAGLDSVEAWRSRLATGFAAAAVGSSQPVQAIEYVQKAVNAEPKSPDLWQALSDLLASAGLIEEAMDAARRALALDESLLPLLLWFAERAISLDRARDAINALSRAVKTDVRNVPVHLKLAHALLKDGQRPQALAALERIVNMPSASFQDLIDSAGQLLAFGEPSLAIACLERARREFLDLSADDRFLLQVAFAQAYQKNGSPQAGLEAAEEAAAAKPEALAQISMLKADLYLQMEKPQDALLSLQAALDAEPERSDLRLRMMNLMRALGDMTGAIAHARQFVRAPLPERLSAAEFALQMLAFDLTEELLAGEAGRLSISDRARHTILKAELALERDGETDLTDEMVLAKRLLDEYAGQMDALLRARLHALEARLMLSVKAFDEMQPLLGSTPPSGVLVSAAEAAVSTGNFRAGVEYAQRAALGGTQEARPHLCLARTLVHAAEMQRLCRTLGVEEHAPGENARAAEAYDTVRDALGAASGRVLSPCPAIQRWAWRGDAVFTEKTAENSLLSVSADDAASAIESLLCFSTPVVEVPQTRFAQHGRVLAAKAFVLAHANPAAAAECADAALEKCPQAHPITPLLLGLKARLAESAGDLPVAAAAMQKAVALWPDETPYLMQAARLSAPADSQRALQYVEAAVTGRPEDAALRLQAAKVLMDEIGEPLRATEMLAQVQDRSLVTPEINVNLAEALSRKGLPAESIAVYRKVFESPLTAQTEWQARVALGFARAATQNRQPATAIAALQDAVNANPGDASLCQALSDAYTAANLNAEALDAARKALALHPTDLEMLRWFSARALALDDASAAVDALEVAARQEPRNVPVLLELSQAYRKTARRREALGTLERIVHLPDLSAADLLRAAEHLLENDESGLAIACLERARTIETDASPETRFAILLTLARAHRRTGNPESGLAVLEEALAAEPTAILKVNPLKADLYVQLGKPQSAKACLEQVLGINPADAGARYQLVEVLRGAGDLDGALEHTRLLLNAPAEPEVRGRAAHFAVQMMQNDLARGLLGDASQDTPAEGMSAQQRQNRIRTLLLAAELDLADGLVEEARVKKAHIESTVETAGADLPAELDARLAALHARLAAAGQDSSAALEAYQRAQASLQSESVETQALQSVFEAAYDLADWNTAYELARQAAEKNLPEPRPYLDLCRALASRAEAQRICLALDIQRHAPGADALSERCREEFTAAVRNATQRATAIQNGRAASLKLDVQAIPAAIQRWWVRGRSAFDEKPSQEILLALSKLPASPEDTAAYIAALGRLDNASLAQQVSRDYAHHPAVLLQLALVQAQTAPGEALATAQTLLEVAGQYPLTYPEPLVQALLALCARRAGEEELAINALTHALDAWDDEAGWHALKAANERASGNAAGALEHMRKAVYLEPERTDYLTELGQMHLRLGDHASAADTFNALTQLQPEDADAWLASGRVSLALGKTEHASACGARAVRLAPDNLEAHLLQARAALALGDAKGSYKAARVAMQLDRENAEVYMVISRAFESLGENEKALRALEKAAELAEDGLSARLERVQLLRRLDGDKSAMPALQDLAEEFPEHPAVLALVAEMLAAAGQIETALQAAQMALQNGAGVLDDLRLAELHHLAGKIFQRAGQLDQALSHLAEAVRLDAENLETHLDLGVVYQDRRQHSQALQVFRKAITLAPEDARPYHQAGVVLKESRDYAGAEKMLQKAARLAPDDVRIQRTLASVAALNLVHGKKPL